MDDDERQTHLAEIRRLDAALREASDKSTRYLGLVVELWDGVRLHGLKAPPESSGSEGSRLIHAYCGGIAQVRNERDDARADLDHAVSENFAFNVKAAKEINEARSQRDAFRAEVERMRPIVEAAKEWRTEGGSYSLLCNLADAIDAALAKEKP